MSRAGIRLIIQGSAGIPPALADHFCSAGPWLVAPASGRLFGGRPARLWGRRDGGATRQNRGSRPPIGPLGRRRYSPAPIITIGIVGVDDPCSGSTVIANAFASTPAGSGGLITV